MCIRDRVYCHRERYLGCDHEYRETVAGAKPPTPTALRPNATPLNLPTALHRFPTRSVGHYLHCGFQSTHTNVSCTISWCRKNLLFAGFYLLQLLGKIIVAGITFIKKIKKSHWSIKHKTGWIGIEWSVLKNWIRN